LNEARWVFDDVLRGGTNGTLTGRLTVRHMVNELEKQTETANALMGNALDPFLVRDSPLHGLLDFDAKNQDDTKANIDAFVRFVEPMAKITRDHLENVSLDKTKRAVLETFLRSLEAIPALREGGVIFVNESIITAALVAGAKT
jgi:hypothetical protein